jgi:hypothetical protein
MTMRAFQDLVDRCGDNPANWPGDERKAAEALLAQSVKARQILADAQRLGDGFAATDITVKAPAGLADRIFAAALRSEDEADSADDDKPSAKSRG